MTDTTSYALPLMTVPRAHAKTITTPRHDHAMILPEDRSEGRVLFGLTLLTLLTTIYSLAQTWSLNAGSTLDHAIRAFLP